jgi:hypothetical protein
MLINVLNKVRKTGWFLLTTYNLKL